MRIGLENAAKIVANYYNLTIGDFRDNMRCRRIARPRQMFMFLAREVEGIDGKILSYPKIGRYLCRDHTSVIAGERRIRKLMATDPQIVSDIAILRGLLSTESNNFKPFKSAAQSAMVFVSGAVVSPFPAPDNLAGRAAKATPSHSFSQVRPVNGIRPSTTRADGHSTKSAPTLTAYRAGGLI